MVKLLLKYGADPNVSLMEARDVDTAKAMLHLGADVNARCGYEGETALMTQATAGDVEMVKFLLQHGADATLTKQQGIQQGETIIELVEYPKGTHPEDAVKYDEIIWILNQAIAKQTAGKRQIFN